MNIHEILKKHYGYESFREGQEVLIQHILKSEDTLGIMPTGAGKSICYQVPAVAMEGISLVISPLISLMKDQVGALNQVGIRAAYFNSSLSAAQYAKALENAKKYMYKIIYVAPERLLNEAFLSFAKKMKIAMVCVDEAHCVSRWGQDFRPSYLKISTFIEALDFRPVISAFSATATQEVKTDIIKMLHMQHPFELVTGFDRENLYFAVEKPKDKYAYVASYIKKNIEKSGIIYCLSRKLVEEVCEKLRLEGISVTRYHAGLSDAERLHNQDAFIFDEVAVMVATNAFGMGIDKSNISYVIHYNMPMNMESYYQEAGRAGRDGKRAECILLYGGQDVRLNQFLIEQGGSQEGIDIEMIEMIRSKERERLRLMTFYCSIQTCLRQYMLQYFGDVTHTTCNNCSNCLANYEEVDIKKEAFCILHCVEECFQRYGISVITDTLRGSKSTKIIQYQMDKNSQYGLLHNKSTTQVRDIIQYLLLENYLELSDSQYPVLKIGTKKLINEEPLRMRLLINSSISKSKHTIVIEVDNNLYELLKQERKKLAAQAKVPPYIVFSDKTLQEMSEKKPKNKEDMLNVSGVGEIKFERYGINFLAVIQNYIAA
ncbi:MAG: DNA helicase RecQ [Longicatena sp.]